MKKHFYSLLALVTFAMPTMAQTEDSTVVIDFEDVPDVTIPAAGYYIGDSITYHSKEKSYFSTVYNCNFKQGPATMGLSYNVSSNFDYWGGIGLSTLATNVYNFNTREYTNVAGGGYQGSKTFAVVTGDESYIALEADTKLKGLYLTNSSYAANGFLNGDSYAKKFDNDTCFFNVTIIGFKGEGDKATETGEVEIKLAYHENGEIKYIKEWQWVDLSTIGADTEYIKFYFDGSDTSSSYGYPMLNTAKYVCIDNLTVTVPKQTTGIDEVNNDDTNVIEVARYAANGTRINTPQRGLNIIKMSDGTTRKEIIR